MTFRPRDARGHFINRQTWEAAYRLAKLPVPKRVGSRNATAPLSRQDVERAARKHKRLPTVKVPKAKRPKGRKVAKTQALFPTGKEFELTARYAPKIGKASVRRLHVKMRVTITSAMTADDAQALLDRAMRDGVTPPGIMVDGIDWSRGSGDKATGSSDEHPGHRDLRNLYTLIHGADATRFAPVESDEEFEAYEDEMEEEE